MITSTKVTLGIVAVTAVIYVAREAIFKCIVKATVKDIGRSYCRAKAKRAAAEQTHQSDAM